MATTLGTYDGGSCNFTFDDWNNLHHSFDIQSLPPGNFLNTFIYDTVLNPWANVTIPWLYTKGDYFHHGTPEHPYEQPFDEAVKWTLDLVTADNNDEVVVNIMPPTDYGVFDKSAGIGGHFDWYHYMWYDGQGNRSCKYYGYLALAVLWYIPHDLELDTTKSYRYRLSTDSSWTSSSATFRFIPPVEELDFTESLEVFFARARYPVYAGLVFLILCWIGIRLFQYVFSDRYFSEGDDANIIDSQIFRDDKIADAEDFIHEKV